ncbi:MAG: Uma2 family endonuclease [Chloroflexota bacterium]
MAATDTTTMPRFTTADLELLPEPLDGRRYEIIDGELHVSKQPSWQHQTVSGRAFSSLDQWSMQTGAGAASLAPGVIFADDENVAPDVVWVSRGRLADVLGPDGKLYAAPDLAVEVLSPGEANVRRDRDAKRKLYSLQGVREYWIVDWQLRQMHVYRRGDAALQLIATLYEDDVLESPLLPSFHLQISQLFAGLP